MTEASHPDANFIWADKTALGLALFAVLIWGAAWVMAFMVIGDLGATYLWLHLGLRWTNIGVLILMSAWLVLRTLDLAAGGATFTLARQTGQVLEDVFARAGRAFAKPAHSHGPQVAR